MTFAGPQLQRLLVEFGDKMGDFCGDERILAENRCLNVAWVSTQLRLYWKEGVYASYTQKRRHRRPIPFALRRAAKGRVQRRILGGRQPAVL